MIRLFKDSDEPSCKKVVISSIKQSPLDIKIKNHLISKYSEKNFIKIAKKGIFLVYEENKVIKGVAGLENDILRRNFVHPNYQKQWIGSKLIKYREDLAKKQGYNSVTIYTFEYNVPFYKKKGYSRIKTVIFSSNSIELKTIEMKKIL